MTSLNSSYVSLGITLALCACTTVATRAFAADPVKQGTQPPSISVEFRDLNLATEAGNRELLERLSKAASRVCWRDARARNEVGLYEAHACYERTLALAVENIHQIRLSALFARRGE